MRIRYVTSMNRKIFDEYGKEMLQGLVALWPEGEIHCYSEDRLPEVPRVTYRNLMEVPGFEHFHNVMSALPIFRGEIVAGQRNYTHDARTFSKKAFAYIDAAVEFDGWLLWVDADVHTKKFIPRAWIEDWMIGSFMVVMKRKTWHMCSSFYGMDCTHSFAAPFLQHWYDVWTTGKFLLQIGKAGDPIALAVDGVSRGSVTPASGSTPTIRLATPTAVDGSRPCTFTLHTDGYAGTTRIAFVPRA